MSKKCYSIKSTLILQNYTPEAIQELLKSGESKSSVAHTLGVHMKAFNEYIQKYNLTYQYSRKSKSIQKHNREQEKKYNIDKPNNHLTYDEEDHTKKFYEMLTKKREKRMLRELKNPYDW